mmetsp:Transcript_4025/g.8709  ORF Transcript_4025/g.8709 Transcript_4025/m.8709 type:complete len:361 (-) Transcript_4025:520-1602(-)|eukprot:CAMPEP_0202891906 /NCGR_PEP_ID=MMETSP1392-20130828/1822_1 /ASSEMBLY_ACC=CAM_ASM_000868 /TAXON_ID=225041 /ORGANISM="Chlamydomonas chlamydogama, Strain SAG 11-48b" /LENGTH=360 /DNA_ID=CAMNT_0049575773 /DNA_START=117 /DNA_END=1199 /DNA_ORIENTATION=+
MVSATKPATLSEFAQEHAQFIKELQKLENLPRNAVINAEDKLEHLEEEELPQAKAVALEAARREANLPDGQRLPAGAINSHDAAVALAEINAQIDAARKEVTTLRNSPQLLSSLRAKEALIMAHVFGSRPLVQDTTEQGLSIEVELKEKLAHDIKTRTRLVINAYEHVRAAAAIAGDAHKVALSFNTPIWSESSHGFLHESKDFVRAVKTSLLAVNDVQTTAALEKVHEARQLIESIPALITTADMAPELADISALLHPHAWDLTKPEASRPTVDVLDTQASYLAKELKELKKREEVRAAAVSKELVELRGQLLEVRRGLLAGLGAEGKPAAAPAKAVPAPGLDRQASAAVELPLPVLSN